MRIARTTAVCNNSTTKHMVKQIISMLNETKGKNRIKMLRKQYDNVITKVEELSKV